MSMTPMIGIYFVLDGTILADCVPVEQGEPYGDALTHGGHYDFHENITPRNNLEYRFSRYSYDYYPRGRIVFFPGRDTYVLYRDACLTEPDLNEIVRRFGLEGRKVVVESDEHYRCSKCNRGYLGDAGVNH